MTNKDISNFFTERNKYLTECATNILKLIKRQDLANELVTDCYLYLNDNKDKLSTKMDEGVDLEAYCVRWMVMQIRWRDTQFKKNWIKPNMNEVHLDDTKHSNVDYTYLDSIVIEEDDEEQILQREMEYQNKLNHITTFKDRADFQDKMLYEIIFERGINTSGKLSKYLGLSRTPSYRLMKTLKDKIRDTYTDNEL
jgi:hypothetical protein